MLGSVFDGSVLCLSLCWGVCFELVKGYWCFVLVDRYLCFKLLTLGVILLLLYYILYTILFSSVPSSSIYFPIFSIQCTSSNNS